MLIPEITSEHTDKSTKSNDDKIDKLQETVNLLLEKVNELQEELAEVKLEGVH